MRRWLEIVLSLVMFAALVGGLGTTIHMTVPNLHAWLIEHAGQAGFWAFSGLIVAVGAYAIYRSNRGGQSKHP